MTGKTIFLSYRRDDNPGYVSRLDAELKQAFGDDSVFRDVEDIEGGRKWLEVIEQNLRDAAALILVVGPRWREIWSARKDDSVNHVALELEQARQHGVRIFPVTINGASLSSASELGDSAWVLENQTYDISDKQGRWSRDVEGLIELLARLDGLERVKRGPEPPLPPDPQPAPKNAFSRFAWTVTAIALVIGVGLALDDEPVDDGLILATEQAGNEAAEIAALERAEAEEDAAAAAAEAAHEATIAAIRNPNEQSSAARRAQPASPQPPAQPVPNIAGEWLGKDGTYYYVSQFPDGTFTIESPDYTNGRGRFIPNMPNKFEVQMQGVGRGEFAVSSDGQKAMGWIVVDGQQVFDTLTRVQ